MLGPFRSTSPLLGGLLWLVFLLTRDNLHKYQNTRTEETKSSVGKFPGAFPRLAKPVTVSA